MAHGRAEHGVVAVAGGLLAVSGTALGLAWLVGGNDVPPDELFDEASGRWFELPHPMAQPRNDAAIVSLPATALALALALAQALALHQITALK